MLHEHQHKFPLTIFLQKRCREKFQKRKKIFEREWKWMKLDRIKLLAGLFSADFSIIERWMCGIDIIASITFSASVLVSVPYEILLKFRNKWKYLNAKILFQSFSKHKLSFQCKQIIELNYFMSARKKWRSDRKTDAMFEKLKSLKWKLL